MSERISPRQFLDAEGVDDWRVLGEGACAYFRTGAFAAGARFVQALADLADLDPHHPDVDLRSDGVHVRLVTTSATYYGLSQRDIELARQISAMARRMGMPSDPS